VLFDYIFLPLIGSFFHIFRNTYLFVFFLSVVAVAFEELKNDKVFPIPSMKAYRESRGITPLILNLGSRWRGILNFIPRPLCSRERTPVPLELWLAGPQSQSGLFGEDRYILPLSGFEPQTIHPIIQSLLTDLVRLQKSFLQLLSQKTWKRLV